MISPRPPLRSFTKESGGIDCLHTAQAVGAPPLEAQFGVPGRNRNIGQAGAGSRARKRSPLGGVHRHQRANCRFFGASSVASALGFRSKRDPAADTIHSNMPSASERSKQDISTLQGIGHFYFALTGRKAFSAGLRTREADRGPRSTVEPHRPWYLAPAACLVNLSEGPRRDTWPVGLIMLTAPLTDPS